MQTVQNGRGTESEAYAEQSFFESPFLDSHQHEQEEPHEASIGEALAANWEFVTPFLPVKRQRQERLRLQFPKWLNSGRSLQS